MTRRLVSIYLGDFATASLIRATIEEHGIPALLNQPHMSYLFPWLVYPGAGLTPTGQVAVPESEVDRCKEILRSVDVIEAEPFEARDLPSTGLAMPLVLGVVLVGLLAQVIVWLFSESAG